MFLDKIANRLTRNSGNIQNPAIPLTAANIDSYLAKDSSSSGVRVSKDSVLANPALYNGIRLLSESVAKLPLVTYRELPNGGKERARQHPAYKLLLKQPNESTTAFDFIRTISANAILHGNGFALISHSVGGRPLRLLWLDPVKTYPVKIREFTGGMFWTERTDYISNIEGRDFRFPSNDILHIKSFGHDDMVGHSILDVLKEPLGLALAHQRYSAKFFENDGTPRLIVTLPFQLKKPEDIERFRKSWGDIHKGVNNAHKVGILEGGADVKPLNVNPDDAQLIESMEMDVKSIANILGVPASLLNANMSTSYNSLEQQNRFFGSYSIGGLICNWRSECQRKLLSDLEREEESHSIDFNMDDLERSDRATETTANVQELNNGIKTLNEIRSKMNLPSVPDDGDKFRIPLNINEEIGTEEEDSTPPPEEEDEQGEMSESDADRSVELRAQLLQAVSECVTRIKLQANRASGSSKRFGDWLDGLHEEKKMFVQKLPGSHRTGIVAESYLARLHHDLLEASGHVTESQLPDCVSQIVGSHELEQPMLLVAELLEETP